MTALDPQDRFLTLLEEHDKILYKVASSCDRLPGHAVLLREGERRVR